MSKIEKLAELGQSLWLDFISRDYINGGKLAAMIDDGLRGITSNPTIFDKAIAGSNAYDSEIRELLAKGAGTLEIYEQLAIKDIKSACKMMLPVYEKTKRLDGYVSLEVNPKLAYKTKETIEEAVRLYQAVGAPNLMIKVPATKEGIPAVKELVSHGISVNVTLIFSIDSYIETAMAFIEGLEILKANGGDVSKVASVASFFVSRVDSSVDSALEKAGNTSLQGKIAVANAKIAFKEFGKLFSGERWGKLSESGAMPQRVLWASTGTKNPAYSDVLYVDELIGSPTVNTMPPATIDSFLDHGKLEITLDKGVEEAEAQVAALAGAGVDLAAITDKLQTDGVRLFAESFDSLLGSVEKKSLAILREGNTVNFHPTVLADSLASGMKKLAEEDVPGRIFARDHTVWSDSPVEISNRLGWLDSPANTYSSLDEINSFVANIKSEGFTNALLLGMGGSSLAPEVFSQMFGTKEGYLSLEILDSTHPAAVIEKEAKLADRKTLYIVSTKSGGTVETLSFMKYFFTSVAQKLGKETTQKRFIAITDPGSGLEDMAKSLGFRKIFINDPNIGGRYSALSLFGMVPAALCGIDIKDLLDKTFMMVAESKLASGSPAALGVLMSEGAKAAYDKVTFITPGVFSYFGPWAEQLIAESTGKVGKGILPVEGEEVLDPSGYAGDRIFVYLSDEKTGELKDKFDALVEAGHPGVEIIVPDKSFLGYEFLRWEIATAIAGWGLGIHPFDQPDVESAKVSARAVLKQYKEEGKLPEPVVAFEENGLKVVGDISAKEIKGAIAEFMKNLHEGNPGDDLRSYLSIQAYVPSSPETDHLLKEIRDRFQTKYRLAVTTGYGPRFLHSTGQLHKGDSGNGLFLQVIAGIDKDAMIPEEAGNPEGSMSFGTLVVAQAMGDRSALTTNGRKVITFFGGSDVRAVLEVIKAAI
ncbi:MAG: bifunctional transaldolase/phosoglucose isomerase [Bacteroidetes bacterium]|nr:bifunctional transaldolase/phosoglucose isomerase [Bacteroidota bacterium]